jgi:hypothetical protein
LRYLYIYRERVHVGKDRLHYYNNIFIPLTAPNVASSF